MNELLPYIMPTIGSLTFILGIWWRVEGKIEAVGKKAQGALDKLAAHELHAAEIFATKAGVYEQTVQVMRAIETLGSRMEGRMDGITDRLDRLYESSPRRTTSSRG